MKTKIAYLAVIIIWATTPLAIKWSSEGVGFLFGITTRMILGLIVSTIFIHILGRRMPWHRGAGRERGLIEIFFNENFGHLRNRPWASHPKGYYQPGVLALAKIGDGDFNEQRPHDLQAQ